MVKAGGAAPIGTSAGKHLGFRVTSEWLILFIFLVLSRPVVSTSDKRRYFR